MINKIKKLGLKATPQRLAILKILENNKSHPSAEDIYRRIKPDFPSLSMATVYNTMEVLARAGELQEVLIKPDKRHFDPNPVPHTHFLCRCCDNIFDLDVDALNIEVPGKVDGYLLESSSVCLYGICPGCQEKGKG
ncbi:MAG: Fur family transcriptional regulator [Bacillota bacterium]